MNRSRTPGLNPSNQPFPNFLLWLAFPLIMGIVLGFSWRPLGGGDDFWAHAAIGRWAVEHGRLPNHTLFLWSESSPWIAHAWGTGVIFAELMHLGGEKNGPVLVQLFNMVMCAIPYALLWRFWRKNAPYSSLIPPLFVLAIWVGAARYHPRPELFTALFMTLLLLFLREWPRQKTAPIAQTLGICFIFVLWPNLHGAVAIGLVLLWLTAICELFESRGDLRLMVIAAVCTLIVFVFNPRGFEYYRVMLPIASKTFQKIDEWKPFWAWPQLALELTVGEFLLWGLAMLIWATNPSRRFAQFAWLLFMGAAFLKARRQLWLTGLTALFVIVSNASHLQSDALFHHWRRFTKGDVNEKIPVPMRLIMRVGVLIVLVCAVAQAIPKDVFSLRATDRRLPVDMAKFLLAKAPRGRILNDYEYSAYLEWALHDRRKLYIDLNNAYPDSLMDEYFDLLSSSKNPKVMAGYDNRRGQILARRRVEVVTLRPYNDGEGLSLLAKYLDKNANWKRIYKRNDGTVWARK